MSFHFQVIEEIMVLKADKGNRTVMDKSDYLGTRNILLHFGEYEHIKNDPMANLERKVEKLLCKHKSFYTPAQLYNNPLSQYTTF